MNANFFDTWNIYQKIVKNNYMYHQEIINCLKESVSAIQKLSILDLGCGDAYIIANAITPTQLNSYLGIDTSEPAIEYGKMNLYAHDGNIQFLSGDMSEEIQTLTNLSDLIIAGYSLHHLQTMAKKTVISKIFNLLKDEGIFVFYDVTSKPDENEWEYKKRSCNIFKNKWTALTQTELDSLISHIMESDHPESQTSAKEMLNLAGFNHIKLAFEDQDKLFSLFVARKDSLKG